MSDKLFDCVLIIIISIVIILLFVACSDDKSDVTPLAQSDHYSSYRSQGWGQSTRKAGDYRSLENYYEIDEDGHIVGPKEGTIRNGKPYHKEDN